MPIGSVAGGADTEAAADACATRSIATQRAVDESTFETSSGFRSRKKAAVRIGDAPYLATRGSVSAP